LCLRRPVSTPAHQATTARCRAHLAVVPRVAALAPALVHALAVAAVETGHHALAELAARAIVAGPAPGRTDPSPRRPACRCPAGRSGPRVGRPGCRPRPHSSGPGSRRGSRRRLGEARAEGPTWRRAGPAVHALWHADGLSTALALPTGAAEAAAGAVTEAAAAAGAGAGGVRPQRQALLPQAQLQRGPGQLPPLRPDLQTDGERRDPGEVAGARQPDGEGWR
jgi:hypothetical protein